MRLVFGGASHLAVRTIERLNAQARHDIVVIEKDKAQIDSLSDDLDAAFIQGDTTLPSILREANPKASDFFFAVTSRDESNIIAGLAAKSLGFSRVVVLIQEESYEPICQELGLDEILIPLRSMRLGILNMIDGADEHRLSDYVRGDLRLFSFRIPKDSEIETVKQLALPKDTRPIIIYGGDDDLPQDVSPDAKVRPGDEVVLLTRRGLVKELQQKFAVRAT